MPWCSFFHRLLGYCILTSTVLLNTAGMLHKQIVIRKLNVSTILILLLFQHKVSDKTKKWSELPTICLYGHTIPFFANRTSKFYEYLLYMNGTSNRDTENWMSEVGWMNEDVWLIAVDWLIDWLDSSSSLEIVFDVLGVLSIESKKIYFKGAVHEIFNTSSIVDSASEKIPTFFYFSFYEKYISPKKWFVLLFMR